MNKHMYDLALQVGGSHYPGVGGRLFEQTIELMLKEFHAVALENPTWTGQQIADELSKRYVSN